MSLYSLLFWFFTVSQSHVCWRHLITTRSCISYFGWEIHGFSFQSNSVDFWELCECTEVLLFERDTNAEVRYYKVPLIFWIVWCLIRPCLFLCLKQSFCFWQKTKFPGLIFFQVSGNIYNLICNSVSSRPFCKYYENLNIPLIPWRSAFLFLCDIC